MPLGVVAEGEAQVVDVVLDQALGHADIAPDPVEDVVLGQQAVRVIDEQPEKLEGLVTDGNGLIALPQAFVPQIEPVFRNLHRGCPSTTELS
jgi:hypothetical protein